MKKNANGTVTITKKITVNRDNLPKSLVEGMIDMNFNPMTWLDGYTMASWKSAYGEDMIEAVRQLVIEPMKAERKKHEDALNAITKKYTR